MKKNMYRKLAILLCVSCMLLASCGQAAEPASSVSVGKSETSVKVTASVAQEPSTDTTASVSDTKVVSSSDQTQDTAPAQETVADTVAKTEWTEKMLVDALKSLSFEDSGITVSEGVRLSLEGFGGEDLGSCSCTFKLENTNTEGRSVTVYIVGLLINGFFSGSHGNQYMINAAPGESNTVEAVGLNLYPLFDLYRFSGLNLTEAPIETVDIEAEVVVGEDYNNIDVKYFELKTTDFVDGRQMLGTKVGSGVHLSSYCAEGPLPVTTGYVDESAEVVVYKRDLPEGQSLISYAYSGNEHFYMNAWGHIQAAGNRLSLSSSWSNPGYVCCFVLPSEEKLRNDLGLSSSDPLNLKLSDGEDFEIAIE
ncbi:MAG: hypothetical protein K6E32_09750 [Lachnospiraceae bacterium]|nr:hypothetical protein [Lachnospiraceae bacterium]